MEKKIKLLCVLFVFFIAYSCIDRDLIDLKDGIILPPVANLESSIDGDNITVNWTNPSNIPSEISRPHFIYVQVYRENTLEYQISLSDEPTTFSYILVEPKNKYRVVVKTMGYLEETIYGKSDEIYSLGQTVVVN